MEQSNRYILIHNATHCGDSVWLLIENGIIKDQGTGTAPQKYRTLSGVEVIDAEGSLLLPGAIDAHVHFREPGLTHKATIESESLEAALGGVTTFFDMPNTKPPTTTMARIDEKMAIAAKSSWANYAFFIGVTDDNVDEVLAADFSRVPGIKLFMGSSTGNMCVSDATVRRVFKEARYRVVIHAEDDAVIAENRIRLLAQQHRADDLPMYLHSQVRDRRACVSATRRALELAEEYGTLLHIAHVSTADEIEMIKAARRRNVDVTCEVSPHHLLFCDDDYERLGWRIKMNPSVKSAADREALRRAVRDGVVNIIATDHAPHTREEKQGGCLTAASGAPMVRFSLEAMLTLFGPDIVERTMCNTPAELFRVIGRGFIKTGTSADIVLVRKESWTVDERHVGSKYGWTPMIGQKLDYKVSSVFVNGLPFRCRVPQPVRFFK